MKLASVGVLCLSVVGLSFATDSWAAIKRTTHVQAQDLGPALETLAKEHGFQVLYRTEIVGTLRARSLEGDFTTDEALRELLNGTGLTYRVLGEKAISIVPTTQVAPAGATSNVSEIEQSDAAGATDRESATIWPRDRLRVSQLAAGDGRGNVSVKSSLDSASATLEEVVVTAEKRSERLLDVPIPVAVLKSDQLTASNQTRLQDYYNQVPGLTMTDMVGGTPALVIRGITTGGFGNPTVGTTIDDAPVGFSTGTGGGYQAIDLDPSDLRGIEVLRGPQGTLYGASSMGGLLKYVTLDPSTERASLRVETAAEDVQNGHGFAETFRASANLPLTEDLAISASGFARHDEGYIDDTARNLTGINNGDAYGGRFALLWKPSQDFSIKLNVIHQAGSKSASDDVAAPDLDALQAGVTFIPGGSGYEQRTTFVSSLVNWNPGPVDLTSVTAYSRSHNDLYLNLYTLSGLSQAFFGVSGAPFRYDTEGHKFSQELRASIPLGSRVDWLLGGFYTDESSSSLEQIQAADAVTGVPVGTLLADRYPTTYREYAAFTNFTIGVTDQLDIQLGARESEIRQSYADAQAGPLAAPPTPTTRTSANAFTFLVTPEYKLSPDAMLYVRLASGYRAGGPNFHSEQFGLPSTFAPDKTKNYDIGLKGRAFGQLLTYDASLYYIDWSDIQIREIDGGFASVANAGSAKSEGVELSITLNPLRGLTVSAWSAYNNAVLTSDLPPRATAVAESGDRLPYSSRWSGNLSMEQTFPINPQMSGFFGASANFVGDRLNDFTPTGERVVLPSYNKVDLHAGVDFDNWRVNLFANNVTNERGIVAKAYASPAYHLIKPRTLGVTISARF